jgi:hypothetical protein
MYVCTYVRMYVCMCVASHIKAHKDLQGDPMNPPYPYGTTGSKIWKADDCEDTIQYNLRLTERGERKCSVLCALKV